MEHINVSAKDILESTDALKDVPTDARVRIRGEASEIFTALDRLGDKATMVSAAVVIGSPAKG